MRIEISLTLLLNNIREHLQCLLGIPACVVVITFPPAYITLLQVQTCPCRARSYTRFVHNLLAIFITLPCLVVIASLSPGSPNFTPDQCLYLCFPLMPLVILRIASLCCCASLCPGLMLVTQVKYVFVEVSNFFIVTLHHVAFANLL